MYILTSEEGGRSTPFGEGYKPQCFFRTNDVTTTFSFPEGEGVDHSQMIMPGDNIEMVGELIKSCPLEVNQRFNLREGGKTVGTGLITRIIE